MLKTLTPKQCRAARSLLNLSQPDLSSISGIHIQTISKFENDTGSPSQSTLDKLFHALELAGIEFIDGGVRENDTLLTLSGSEGFETFLDDVYQTALQHGTHKTPCKIFVSNAVHSNWIKWMGKKKWESHVQRMVKIKNKMDIRIIVKEKDNFFPAISYSQYKWSPDHLFNDKSFYSYHDKLAFLNFKDDDVSVTIMRQAEFAEGYRSLFEIAWDQYAKVPSALEA